LKAWMKKEMSGALSIDGSGLTKSIQAELSKVKLRLNVDTDALKNEVSGALTSAFSTTHRVNIDAVALAAQVRGAVANGLSGAGGGAAGSAASAAPAALSASLVPVIDRMVKSIEDAVQRVPRASKKKAGASGDDGDDAAAKLREAQRDSNENFRARRAARRYDDRGASQDQADANRTYRFRENFQNNVDSEVGREVKRIGAQSTREQAAAVKALKDETVALAAAEKARNDAWEAIDRQRKASTRDERNAAFAAAEAAQQSQRVEAERKYGAAIKSRADVQKQSRTAAMTAARGEIEDFERQIDQAAAAQKRMAELRAKSASAVDSRALLGLHSDSEMSSFTAQLRAQMQEQVKIGKEAEAARKRVEAEREKDRKLEIARAYEAAKMDASGTYTGRGTSIAAARRTAGQFGDQATREFLGSKAGLLDRTTAELENFRKKVAQTGGTKDKATASTKALNAAVNDLHSGVRGLAGSVGAMWLTWGNTAAIAGMAALGASVRSVYTVGKDLEYQLAFVKVLSDGTTVSLKEFSDTVRGSLTTPVEAAQALRALAQNGLSAREALQALPTVLALATAGEMSLTEAALGATGVMAAFNLKVEDLPRIADVFAKAAAISNTNVASMVEAMKQASTVSDQYKVSLEETAASLSVLAKRNIEGSAAGTAFRNMMSELATPSKKARDALKTLGLELYDQNKQLKSFSEVLSQLKDKTAVLNEKGRLAFLRDVFDERGAKAANALLTDYDLLGTTLDKLKHKSEGFAQSVSDALGSEVEGKLKRLMSEFQLSTAGTFNEVSTAVGNLVDQLRVAASSTEFKQFLKTVTDGVINLTRFFIEHYKAVEYTVLVWLGLRGVLAAVEVWGVLTKAIGGATTALAGLRVGALAAAGALTGGVALVLALGTEYLLLGQRTNEAREAQIAFRNQLVLQDQALDSSISKLKQENEQLDKRIQLQRQGYSGSQARQMVEDAAAQKEKTDDRDKARAALEKAAETYRQAKERKAPGGRGFSNSSSHSAQVTEAEANLREAIAIAQKADAVYTKFLEEQELKRTRTAKLELDKRLADANAFNRQLYDFRLRSKKNTDGLFITQGEATTGDKNDFDAMFRERQAKFNKLGGDYSPIDKSAKSAAHREAMAEARQIIEGLREEEAAAKQTIKFQRELNEARFNPTQFGPYMAAKVQEQESLKESERLLGIESNAILELLRIRVTDQRLTEADKTNIDTELKRRQASISLLQEESKHRAELLKVKAQERMRQDVQGEDKQLRSLSDGDAKQLASLKQKYDVKATPGATVAQREAELQVEERYRDVISQKELKIKEVQEGQLLLAEMIDTARKDELPDLLALHEAATNNLAVEQQRLEIVKEQAKKAKESATTAARTEYEKSQTAQYGWDRFWKEYVEQGTSSATIVYDAMKATARGMEDALANFILKGKGGFKSLVATILAEVARMLATQAMKQFIGIAMSFIPGFGSGSGATVGGVNGSAGTPSTATFAENGHVMTSNGPMQLRKYAGGGVARRPQLAVFGEGSMAEAYVPLPDGRTIPVTMKGGGGGGDTHVITNVNIQSDGNSKVESDVNGEKAGALGKMLEHAVMTIIAREKRPGGLIYN
jgi:TP901 family phage tail tape measure protein/lambda family phage tail tape measure protein